jgi:hypothetical protein
MDTRPARVAVFTLGIDNPARVEVAVGSRTSGARAEAGPGRAGEDAEDAGSDKAGEGASWLESGAQGQALGGSRLYEATGWSETLSFEEAFADALASLQSQIPPGSRNPDVGLNVEVVRIGAEVGGFTLRHGLWIKVQAR